MKQTVADLMTNYKELFLLDIFSYVCVATPTLLPCTQLQWFLCSQNLEYFYTEYTHKK